MSLPVEMGQLQIDSKAVGQKLSAEHNNVGDGERKMATERIDNSSETEDRIPTPTHLEQKENDSRVREKTSGATAKKKLTRKDIKLPEGFENKMAFVLYDVFTKEECNDYIRKTEEMGYEMALVNIGGGRQMKMTDVRNSSRCIWDSFEEVGRIWERIKDHIPEVFKNRKVLGLNERLRFLRYEPGEYFKPHMDGAYRRENGERSYITIMLYLNQDFKGGSTTFMGFNLKNRKEVVPKTGMVLVFDHDIMHEGSTLIKGRKYSMRTDVMYSP